MQRLQEAIKNKSRVSELKKLFTRKSQDDSDIVPEHVSDFIRLGSLEDAKRTSAGSLRPASTPCRRTQSLHDGEHLQHMMEESVLQFGQ